jgi:hypothetical protein
VKRVVASYLVIVQLMCSFDFLLQRFFEQIGEWYVKEECVHKKVEEIIGIDSSKSKSFANACCLKEPSFKCHYRDKPSKHPCKDSPPIDEGHSSFW